MAEARIHANHARASGHAPGHIGQRFARPHTGLRSPGLRQRLRARQLSVIRLGQRQSETLCDQRMPQGQPVLRTPFVVGAGRAVGKSDCVGGCCCCKLPTHRGCILRGVAQCQSSEQAVAGDCMDALRHGKAAAQQPAHGPLIRTGIAAVGERGAETAGPQPRLARHQRGFDEALEIEHCVIRVCMQIAQERSALAAGVEAPARCAPAPLRHRNHTAHPGHQRYQRGKGFFHHPVNLRVRKMLQHILHHCGGLHHVTQR